MALVGACGAGKTTLARRLRDVTGSQLASVFQSALDVVTRRVVAMSDAHVLTVRGSVPERLYDVVAAMA